MKQETKIPRGTITKASIVAAVVMSLIYISWWFYPSHIGHPVLYSLLFFGELYHVLMAFMFWHTVWPRKRKLSKKITFSTTFKPSVDVFITVCGEPKDVVRKTVEAAKRMLYENHQVYILNDGLVANKSNWEEMEDLAREFDITCITRTTPGGAKAGNINHALFETKGEIVMILDADMVPDKTFLQKVIPYFKESNVGFVQTPQYYENYEENEVTAGAWEQQEIFFGPIMVGKDTTNSAFICGTNVAIRRTALLQAGGMNETSIAEDFITSISIHQKGWQSHYLPQVLAKGLAPSDLMSYYKQQLRWARGSLEVFFSANPFFKKGLTFSQKIEYLSSGMYYLNGIIILIDMMMPLLFFFTGVQPVAATTTSFALFFLPFMFVNLLLLYIVTGQNVTFRAMSFSTASFTLQLRALRSIILRQKMSFSVTPKQAQTGNFIFLAYPHMLYIVAVFLGMSIAINREGMNPSIITNIAWALFNISMFIPFITASMNWIPATRKEAALA